MKNEPEDPRHTLPINEIFSTFQTSKNGLNDFEAEERLKKFGPNTIQQEKQKKFLQMILEHLKDPMILILIGVSIFSFILNEYIESSVILFIIVVNTIISILQEKKAQNSLEALKKMTESQALVLRDNEKIMIPSSELVIGDIIFLEDGMMVPADVRLIDSSSLKIQEASLTGESMPSEKDADEVLEIDCPLSDRSTMAYSSTFVTYGRGTGVVTATGMNTEVGKIAYLINHQNAFDTPLKRKLNAVGKILTIIGMVVCILIFGIGYLYGQEIIPLTMTAISLAISVIPEGLPATATIVLALGVQKMAKQRAIIKKLPAVETLGGATVICSDKTGTLTLNKMIITELAISNDFNDIKTYKVKEVLQEKNNYFDLILAGVLCNNSKLDPENEGNILGDPTEGALIFLAESFGEDYDELNEKYTRLYEQPFDSNRKRMSTVNLFDKKMIGFTKGAADELIPVCNKILYNNEEHDITKEDIDAIQKAADDMASKALRVLAFAKKTVNVMPEDGEDIETNLTFIGLVGMTDPPREETKKAVQTCYEAGIRTVMITGDHKITATAIAKELSIWKEGDTVYTGTELDKMSEKELDNAVVTTSVYARVTPEQKLSIVQSLKRTGEIVAMTGDGVNDAPALKTADIGIAMGISGTDVAKDAADMIITDDNFATITDAVKEGRRVYRNIQKVIQFLLAGNIGEIITIFIATLFNFPTPLLAVHILWVNLATDTLPALALGVDFPEEDIMRRKPLKSKTLFEGKLIKNVILQGVLIAFATLLAFFIGYKDDLESAQAMAFCTIAFSQLIYSYSQRSDTEFIFSKNFFRNRYLLLAILLSISLMILLFIIPSLRNIFKLSSVTPSECLIILILSFIPTIVIEIIKLFKYFKNKVDSK